MLRESIKMSWQNIKANKMRSFLTVLGIIIGVTAVISLVTIVEGLTNEITSQFEELGAGKIAVQAYGTPFRNRKCHGRIACVQFCLFRGKRRHCGRGHYG